MAPPAGMAGQPRADGWATKLSRPKIQYVSDDIDELLENEGVSRENAGFPSYLPLEAFDDLAFEQRSPDEWMALGKGEGVPARAMFVEGQTNEIGRWRECRVLNYDQEYNLYEVDWMTAEAHEKLPRIAILFVAEDPALYAKRVAHAYKARIEAESCLRYKLYVESMPTDEIPPLDRDQVERILASAFNTQRLQEVEDTLDVPTLLTEVNTEFAQTMNRIIFDLNLEDPKNKELFKLLTLPPPPEKEPAPYLGVVSIPEHDFGAQCQRFAELSFLTRLEVIIAMERCRAECNRVLKLNVFNISHQKTATLEEYVEVQTSARGHLLHALKESWLNAIKTGIRTSLEQAGEGVWNMQERDHKVYKQTKLRNLLQNVHLMMQDTLRYMTESSLESYADFLENATDTGECIIESCREVTNTNIPADSFTAKKPLFTVDLIDQEGQFKYSNEPRLFRERPLEVFETAIEALQDIPSIEPLLMDRMFWPEMPKLGAVSASEDPVNMIRDRINSCLQNALAPLNAYVAQFDSYLEFLQLNVEDHMEEFKQEEKTVQQLQEKIEFHRSGKQEIEDIIPKEVAVGAFLVCCEGVSKKLANKHQTIMNLVLELAASKARERCAVVAEQFQEIYDTMQKKPVNVEQVVEIRTHIKTIPETASERQSQIDEMLLYHGLLEKYMFHLPKDDFVQRWEMYGWPKKIDDEVEVVSKKMDRHEREFFESQTAEQEKFKRELDELEKIVAAFGQFTDIKKEGKDGFIADHVRKIQAKLKEYDERAKLFNSREALFVTEMTDYTQVQKIAKDFEPYANLWLTTTDWKKWKKSWKEDPFDTLPAEEIEQKLSAASKIMYKCTRFFKENAALCAIATRVKEEMDAFKPNIPLIQSLRNPGMRARHWEQLSSEVGIQINPDDNFTLAAALQMGLGAHMDKVTRIGEIAGKEFAIETALDKMENEWQGVELLLKAYRETGTCVLGGFDEVSQQLDDHIMMTQAMSFSPYKKTFEERVTTWEKKLNTVSEVLDEWIACQRNWMYLEPIFRSDDINKQLPVEGKRFATVDRNWRKTITSAQEIKGVIDFCADEKLLEQFQESNKLLDMVSKGLNEYLEAKRDGFPRFYFLSNDELLQILSQTKDPKAVNPHLPKIFENIFNLEFQGEDLKMVAMFSGEKERVPFYEGIYPKGNVETWLTDVEYTMKMSVRNEMFKGIKNYVEVPRKEWVLSWPAQVVLNGSQLWWTREIEQAIEEKGHQGVVEYYDKTLAQLDDLVVLVRGELTVLSRMTLGALIVVEVHARDVVNMLVETGLSNTSDFEWISQLRYYWEKREDPVKKGLMNGEDEDMWVRMMQSCQPYGYEYLGNTLRLVITPLTDRCYMTLMGALHLCLGGAPAGPAGTGKTETTKDMAKALAKQCVVFNCSDGLDYLAMGKFFKGLSSSGAWACFDEFNRIDIEVLSVIAQQLITILQAVKARAKRFVFEGKEIPLDPTTSTYITMNPGYAGRTELPDNLKALFRPVAMMVPDYGLIGEIMMFSFGFSDSKPLSKKMVATFRLSSEQLSSQDHYDFGMRAVKTVITAAGNLKRDEPDENEEILLLRALNDVNVPKFLKQDLPLFAGIMKDLFPGVEQPELDYGDLMQAIRESVDELGLQPHDAFLHKVIQLYDTTVVRHGLMLVGPTGGGKTCNYRTLAKAFNKLKEQNHPKFEKAKYYINNPKSITMGQLYGQFDDATHEWTDGILAYTVRSCAEDQKPDKKWVVFDGPVDAIWIENMNTVLDDNKKLCLNSGEIIKLSPQMTMMFEVEDLAVASPATVSRCGMVYMEPEAMGVGVIVKSWIQYRIPPHVQIYSEELSQLFDNYLEAAIEFVRRNCKEPVPTVDNNLAISLMNIMDTFFKVFIEKPDDIEKVSAEKIKKLEQMIEPYFLFALVWSVGCTTDAAGRDKFNSWLRDHMGVRRAKKPMPAKLSVYQVVWSEEKMDWVPWMSTQPEYKLDPKAPFNEMIVPTQDSVRYTYLMDQLLTTAKHVLQVGPTGVGKTVNIQQHMLQGVNQDIYMSMFVNFSAQTSANQTQDILDAKMDKRRKGVYGPPAGKQYLIFVDDLNMPAREKYFAQPPIELLRQWMDHEGWYDRKTLTFMQIVDIVFLAAMGPPGGGRNPVTNRLLRHFNIIGYTDIERDAMITIFGTIVSGFLAKFEPDVQSVSKNVVEASCDVYFTILAELLPTPSKSHYTFNMRDLAKVMQGMLSADSKKITEGAQFWRLWVHECRRVFQDRLINMDDRNWFDNLLKELFGKYAGKKWDDVVPARLIYGDYMVPGADPRIYDEVTDLEKLRAVMNEYLDDYNNQTNSPMRLVLFLDAIEHASKISRIIRQDGGNALLLGVGGSGRQSMSKLAAFINDMVVFQVEISKGYGSNEWRDDIKKFLKSAGEEGKPTVFLFSDTQIFRESCLEDLNNILNTGEVPNIMGLEDLDGIFTAVRPICQAKGLPMDKTTMYSQFLVRVRQNLHMVLAMTPVGDQFRDRLRMFPSLVNNCTIDWFLEWPEEALVSVATTVLADVELATPEIRSGIIEMCMKIHKTVETRSVDYKNELGRYNYVTPTSYLELLGTYQSILADKRDEVGTLKRRLEVGLTKLKETEDTVDKMQTDLEELQPVLVKTQTEVEEMMVVIAKDKEAAAETKTTVEAEEAVASAKQAECKAIADDAQADLDEALPALDAALASLKSLKKDDIVEVKALKSPPAGVKLVIEAVCIMQGVKPNKVNDPNKLGKKIDDYWEPGKALLQDPQGFLNSLFSFDKDSIPEAVIKKIKPYIDNPSFTPEAIAKVSQACKSICEWVRAMEKYHHIAVAVEPKKQNLAKASAELEVTNAKLADAKARLQAVMDKVAKLEADYDGAIAKKEALTNQVQECEIKLSNAHKLIGGLGGEKIRWTEQVRQLNTDFENLQGDVIVASGAIAYLGPFVSEYRESLSSVWRDFLEEKSIPHTPGCNMQMTLADPVKIRTWTIAGLPSDAVSVENGIIVSRARRWPLMIDPQGQANKWIKNMEKTNSLEVVKASDKDYLRTLCNAIRFGKPVLMEKMGEDLDSALEPILLKQTYKQGGAEVIRIGEEVIEWSPDFKFYMTTLYRNPHYAPEVCVKVSLLNFTVTMSGLQDQLLGVVVAKEKPELAEAKEQLVLSNAQNKKDLKEIGDKILYMLSNSDENILMDVELINTLAESKVVAEEIMEKVAEAEVTEKEIDETRAKYVPVAFRAAIIFFCIADLAVVDPMYQYSLPWFTMLFESGILEAEPSDELEVRLESLNSYFTYKMYNMVCTSLFEKHKLLFSFMLCIRLLMGNNEIDSHEWRFLNAGGTSDKKLDNPAPEWLTEQCWSEVLSLSHLDAFQNLETDFPKMLASFKEYFDSVEPESAELPGPWQRKLNSFQRMLVLRALRPDKMIPAIQLFVTEKIGKKFIEPPSFDLANSFKDATAMTPLIFVLSAGADPLSDLFKFADELGMMKKLESISLGQGQGPHAERLISQGMERGGWVLLQNCHLAKSWMPKLEMIAEQFNPDKIHRDFRLWLTSMPSPIFPASILQNGVKMTNEPPKGLKSNMLRQYSSFDPSYLEESAKPDKWRKLLFSSCLFHAAIQERRKFGPLGWNILYEYTSGDLACNLTQLHLFLEDYDEVPYKVLKFLYGQINYGGRITDDWDRRTIMTMLDNYLNEDVCTDEYKYSPSGDYMSPPVGDLEHYLEYLKGYPLNPKPEVFGLHDNADITSAQNETYATFDTILSIESGGGGGGGASGDRENTLDTLAAQIQETLPPVYNIDDVARDYPVMYEESMNTVLQQELVRYNKLLAIMKSSLHEFRRALKGMVVMSGPLETMGNALFDNAVPEMWSGKGYPSLKPLGAWYQDLLARVDFLNNWIEKGIPKVFWMSGFFFPQAFLTGTMQNFARKYQLAIDSVAWAFNMVNESEDELPGKPEDGCYIRGLFLEGARWSSQSNCLVDPRPKELFSDMCIVWLKPEQNRKKPTSGIYNCPVYKILTRAGTLSTTGHSTNFVLPIEIPSKDAESKWICAGVACFLSLRY